MAAPSVGVDDSETALALSVSKEAEAARKNGLQVAAILDPASSPGVWSRFGDLAREGGGGSLFKGTSHVDSTAIAPLLLPLHTSDVNLQNELVDIARAAPAVIWLASPLPPSRLLNKLTAKFHARLANGQAITLRYQDPRVLPELLSRLDADQVAFLCEGVAAWWWFDRENMLRRSRAEATQPPVATATPWLPAIALTDDQVHALLEASFIDRVLDVLQRIRPGAWKGLERSGRNRMASRLIEAAAIWNLRSEFDCASYIAVVLRQGPNFATEPEWSTDMAAVKAGALRFSDAIANWEQRAPALMPIGTSK